jgi:hypothetical protein
MWGVENKFAGVPCIGGPMRDDITEIEKIT